mgnify:FL=1
MEKWVIAAKRADFNQIGQQFHIDPVIARLIRNRDVIGEDKIREYLSGTVQELPSPWLMKDMEKAVDILEKKISQKAKVRIIGDYDIDGVTSTYILMKGLARIGADVDTYIPDRVADGYGIHAHLIERAETDRIDTIVTCDNGIAAAAEIQMAKDKGMTVIITDHHEVPYREEKGERQMVLPPADAILNPKQYDCPYPNKNLCGAVVAFKYIAALYERFGVPEEDLEDYYELAAIATVGDVMDLQGENRILVKEGLCRLKNTKNQGLQELIRANSLEDAKITAYHIGFVLGPCINASGRLDTAARSLALLNAKTKEEAARLAGDLTALNQSRKALTEKGKEEAIRIIETTELKNDRVLVVYLPDCHESLAGIIAGRIREKYHRPAFVLTGGETSAKGSGRSIESYSMYEELVNEIIEGRRLGKEDDLTFLIDGDLESLCQGADKIRKELCGNQVDLCTIINGRAGRCSENCRFCAQSSHHHTGAEEYDVMDVDSFVKACHVNEENGAHRFSIVTAGRTLVGKEFDQIVEAYKRMHEECKEIELCASHGLLTKEQFEILRKVGVTRCHANIETSRRYFPSICTTHTFEDKLACIRAAKEAGLEVCSGGIVGMGETWEDRLDMALTLAELEVDSIPLNALMPIPGTPFENLKQLTEEELLRVIAMFRFINPSTSIRLAAGRKLMKENGKKAFFSGANATITGDMLTTSGNNTKQDKQMLVASGFEI